jgi:hypothetical protein
MGKFKQLLNEENKDAYNMKDAYSFDKIGYLAGNAMLDAARELGYSENESEWIFRSKNSRWFYDQVDGKVFDFVKKLFIEYLKNNEKNIKKNIKIDK